MPAEGGGAEVEPETDGVVHAAALAPVANLGVSRWEQAGRALRGLGRETEKAREGIER